jgi:histidine ammonia-lyase
MHTSTRNIVELGERPPSIADVVAVARDGARVTLTPSALQRIAHSRAIIDALADDTRPHYGVSTGFGALAGVQIPREKRTQLQRSVVRSHAAGTGPEIGRAHV